jgi:lysozyme
VTTVPGIDASYWQSEIEWPSVRASGQRFAFFKATEGLGYTDPTFEDNWHRARDVGLLRGAYCFFHPNQDAKQQAARFINAIRNLNDDGELPCSLDLEVTDAVSKPKILAGVKLWLDDVEQAFGRRPMIYSGVSFLETSLIEASGGPPAWSQDHPLWLGWFPRQYSPGMNPLMPRGWPAWTFWQYSGKGRINGIRANVDLDLFNGTVENLYQFAGLQAPNSNSQSHLVTAADSFQSIADKYDIPLGALMGANPQLLRIGDRLTIPAKIGPPVTPSSPSQTYTVKPGDTLYAVAKMFGTTVSALAQANHIANPNMIQVGQVLVVT